MQGGKIRIVSNEPTSPRKVIRIGQDPPITINHGEFQFGHLEIVEENLKSSFYS